MLTTYKISDKIALFRSKLEALYDIESELEEALPKLAEAATDPELKEGFLAHLEETKEHSKRLEKIFLMLDAEPKKMKSEGIRGIIEDGESIINDFDAPPHLRDAMIAGAARRAEHYEIAGYMTAIEEAEALDLDDAVEILTDTMTEEENADSVLEEAERKALAIE